MTIDPKEARLCRQVADALAMALADSVDPVLRDVVIAGVSPAPNVGRLSVAVFPIEGVDADDLVARLERARGYLRGEVAAAIHRKRTPDLAFRVVLPG